VHDVELGVAGLAMHWTRRGRINELETAVTVFMRYHITLSPALGRPTYVKGLKLCCCSFFLTPDLQSQTAEQHSVRSRFGPMPNWLNLLIHFAHPTVILLGGVKSAKFGLQESMVSKGSNISLVYSAVQ